jgi:hypothetical protein
MEGWQPVARVQALGPLLASLPPEIAPVPQTKAAGAWPRVRRHLGSSITLVLGCLGLIGGLASLARPQPNLAPSIGALIMILGALAYRSAKKRKLGETKTTLTRQALELTLLLLICLIVLAQNNLMYLINTDPVPNLIIPLWAILAYLTVALRPNRLAAGPSS